MIGSADAGVPLSWQEEAFLKRYLEYCRSRSAPVLSETAGRVLANEYVELREEVCPFPIPMSMKSALTCQIDARTSSTRDRISAIGALHRESGMQPL